MQMTGNTPPEPKEGAMPKTNDVLRAMIARLLIIHFTFHGLSGIFTGVWISDLIAPTGQMSLLAWLETIMSAVAIAAGLSRNL